MAKMETNKDLGQLLLEGRYINEAQLNAARRRQAEEDASIGRVLVGMGLISEQTKMAFIRDKFGFEIVNIGNMLVPPGILTRIPRSYAEKFRCVPILEDKRGLVIAMEDPTNFLVLDQIKAQTSQEPIPVLATMADIDKILLQYPTLTQAQVSRIRKSAAAPGWRLVLHRGLFYFSVMAPLLGILVYSWIDDQFGNTLSRVGSAFDVSLYIVLGWCLWAIAVWEIDAVFFTASSEKET